MRAEYYMPAEVAALFRVDSATVTRWAYEGRLTCIRTLGGHRRYPREEVHRLLREGAPPEVLEDEGMEDTADGWTVARHPITALVEDHFGGDAIAALLELAGRYAIAIAYLDRPWFTRYLGRAVSADEWRRIAAELNDFCAVLDDMCARELAAYADLVLRAARVDRVEPPTDFTGDEGDIIAAGSAGSGNTAHTVRGGQPADYGATVLHATGIASEPASGPEPATPASDGPPPIPPPRPGREEPVVPRSPVAGPAGRTTESHQLALPPQTTRDRQAPGAGTTTNVVHTESYLPRSPQRPAELEMSVDVLRERYTAGESVPSIAQRMGLTPRQVYCWMRHERINRRPPGGRTWDFPIELKELREWYEAGETIAGLARALDVPERAVKMRLVESGAKLRSRQDPRRLELPVPSPVLRKRYEAGESLYDLAADMAVATATVKIRLLEAGTKMRPVGSPTRSHQVDPPIPVEQMLQRIEAGESLYNLALELGVPRNTLRGQLEAAAKYGPAPVESLRTGPRNSAASAGSADQHSAKQKRTGRTK